MHYFLMIKTDRCQIQIIFFHLFWFLNWIGIKFLNFISFLIGFFFMNCKFFINFPILFLFIFCFLLKFHGFLNCFSSWCFLGEFGEVFVAQHDQQLQLRRIGLRTQRGDAPERRPSHRWLQPVLGLLRQRSATSRSGLHRLLVAWPQRRPVESPSIRRGTDRSGGMRQEGLERGVLFRRVTGDRRSSSFGR